MRKILYISHPQVQIDPNIPVLEWSLSIEGRTRAQEFAARLNLAPNVQVFSSTERKAMELAERVQPNAKARHAHVAMGENDRSATGFLAPDKFEQHAAEFFAQPDESVKGWERAVDAQNRIYKVMLAAFEIAPDGPIVLCGHGGVGSLLKCKIAGRGISQNEDQRVMANAGGGNCFSFTLEPNHLLCDWIPMEQFEGF